MTKEQIQEIVKDMPKDKRDKIAEMLDKASMLINRAEVEMHDYVPHAGSVFYIDDSVTTWCNLYGLQKIFAVDYGTNF